MMQRWLWLFVLVMAAWSGSTFILDGSVVVGVGLLLVGVALAWWISPWKGGRSVRHADVLAREPEQRQVVIYWRPGCTFCARLNAALGAHRDDATWVNIYQDAEAAEFVRSVNDGNETVPTVVLDGDPVTNPDPQRVLQRLRS